MAEFQTFKPQKNAFLLGVMITVFIIFAVIFVPVSVILYFALGAGSGSLASFALLIAFTALFAFIYYTQSIRYKKTEYYFYHNKIIAKTGGLFSDSQKELIIKNITHVSHNRPYLWNRFFGIGHLFIEAAGSSGLHLTDLDNSSRIYQYVEKLMSKNGFSLKKKTLIQEEQPDKLAVILDIVKTYVTIFAVIAFAGLSSIIPVIIAAFTNPFLALLLVLGGVVVFAGALILSIFSFLDLSRRTYRVYSDTITYNEGFLTKTDSFIPLENVSDSALNQSFIDKLLNLYDVKVSCQGSGKEISFRNMKNGEKLEANIDSAIKSYKSLAKSSKKNDSKTTKTASAPKKNSKITSSYTDEFVMDMKRSLFIFYFILPLSLLGGPLFIFALIGFITVLIRAKNSVFKVKDQSVQSSYSFLSKENIEFSIDKITSVEFKRTLLDRWFKTVSITFYSIGSSQNVIFRYVKEETFDKKKLLQKLGLPFSEPKYELKPDFTIWSYLAINIIGICIFLVLLFASVVVASVYSSYFYFATVLLAIFFLLQLVYLFLRYENISLNFYDGYLRYNEGIITKIQLFVPYDFIKDNRTSHLFFIQKGSVTCNIAGEQVVNTGKNQTMISHSFSVSYLNNISRIDDLLDFIFLKNPSSKDIHAFASSNKALSKPQSIAYASSKNSILLIIIFSVIIFPLLLILPLTLFFAHLVQSRKSFVLEDDRILYRSGVLFKRQQSVLYSKIDSINKYQGAFNKLFNNGNVVINTAGSSQPEMVLRSVIDYVDFYDKINEFYK